MRAHIESLVTLLRCAVAYQLEVGCSSGVIYANAIGIRRGSLAALLVPASEAALKITGEPCYVIGTNLAVRTRREGRLVFVWKDKLVEATPELLQELARFTADLAKLLEP